MMYKKIACLLCLVLFDYLLQRHTSSFLVNQWLERSSLLLPQFDTVSEIAQRYDMGYDEVVAANPGIKNNKLQAGTFIIRPSVHILPKVKKNIVINLSQRRLYYFEQNPMVVHTFPIEYRK